MNTSLLKEKQCNTKSGLGGICAHLIIHVIQTVSTYVEYEDKQRQGENNAILKAGFKGYALV